MITYVKKIRSVVVLWGLMMPFFFESVLPAIGKPLGSSASTGELPRLSQSRRELPPLAVTRARAGSEGSPSGQQFSADELLVINKSLFEGFQVWCTRPSEGHMVDRLRGFIIFLSTENFIRCLEPKSAQRKRYTEALLLPLVQDQLRNQALEFFVVKMTYETNPIDEATTLLQSMNHLFLTECFERNPHLLAGAENKADERFKYFKKIIDESGARSRAR
jgi:hypothetical protein